MSERFEGMGTGTTNGAI